MTASLLFSGWFFYAIYAERNQGATTDRIGGSAEISTRLREDARDWFRRHFPESAARAAENYGIFQYEGTGDIETADEWILLAHGLDEPGNIWGNLAPVLDAGGYRVLEFCYPNDQAIHESARFLADQMSALLAADFETRPSGIHLIGHSMGGLVLRDFLTHEALYPQATWKDNTPVRSLIQIATPNHGSWLATYRLPAELRDHLFKDFGPDAILNMIWDGTGVAQIDLKPESSFLTNLNFRPFPKNIYWVGIAGIGSPVNLASLKDGLVDKLEDLSDSAHSLNDTFPELFKGTGDGCVSIDSLRCEEMDEVFLVEATHRNIIRSPRGSTPPAIPIVMELLSSGQL
ncbi:MAG: alpha/beta fold hydrolase [Verrucomicrobiae bacterium]|nr:alpha/beta fold hydrolase [Verrucomicrobiae bacterium]